MVWIGLVSAVVYNRNRWISLGPKTADFQSKMYRMLARACLALEGCCQRAVFGGLLFANRLMTLSHGAALEALFAFRFLISVDFAFFPLVEGKPTLDSPTDSQIKR